MIARESAEDGAAILDADFGIAPRAGVYCAPLVHQDLGIAELGGVRVSLGPFGTDLHIDRAFEANSEISVGRKARALAERY